MSAILDNGHQGQFLLRTNKGYVLIAHSSFARNPVLKEGVPISCNSRSRGIGQGRQFGVAISE
jgi:hypothetical protein